MKRLFSLIAAIFIATTSIFTRASGLNDLENFVRGAKTGRAEFTQVVTQPAREGQVARSKTSSGSFAFARPGKFRFDYRKPFEQTIVADGSQLWLYDVDLQQVTVRKQSAALGSAPAALIASSGDMKAVLADYQLSDAGQQDGVAWVLATPKSKDAGVASVRVGFVGGELARLEMVDSFGQRSELRFTQVQTNPSLEGGLFQFKPPAGVDVVRQ